jgi:hypothetical protein
MSEEHIQESQGEHVHGPHCNHGHGHEHGHEHHAPAAPSFTKTEVAAMHDEDRKAAGNIVMLMASIFVAGVIGYLFVNYVVSQGM